MMTSRSFLLAAVLVQQVAGQGQPLIVPESPSADASETVSKDVSSFSIESSSLVDYAGNTTHPNKFSLNLLSNLKDATGAFPRIRVGGTTQDRAFYEPDQKEAINSVYENPDDDQPIKVTYGPGYFDAYRALQGMEFSHGFNLAYNGSDQASQLETTAVAACKNMGPSLLLSEIGNEADFFPVFPNYCRPPNWTMSQYVQEWNWKSNLMAKAMEENCPGVSVGFIAPTFIWTNYSGLPPWNAAETFKMGLDTTYIKEIALHSYMNTDYQERLGIVDITMQNLLMNHTSVVGTIAVHLELASNLSYLGLPYTLDEVNGIALQGGEMTYSMGSGLWAADFTLWTAANNIKRINFHEGTGYRYVAWQPIEIDGEKPTTRPPYYAHIMVAQAIGNISDNTRIANLPLPEDTESAYAFYDDDVLARLVTLNMEVSWSNATHRPSKEYTYRVPSHFRAAKVQRFMGAGADARTNITFGGVSYDYALDGGRPVVVDKKATEERLSIKNGVVKVDVPASSGVLLTLLE